MLGIARLAGIMGAKQTANLIPLCHPLGLDHVHLELVPDHSLPGIQITATCRGVTGPTGVEMEAMTAVSTAALTVYDMCKAVDRGMEIGGIRLTHKSGGKSGTYDAGNNTGKPALLAVDDALAAIIATLPHTGTNLLPLSDALGYTLAEDLAARLTLPPQAVSAMDGYAVRGEDVSSLPCQLTRIAVSAAGHPWFGAINEGQAVRVFTGAALPDGADTIVIQEDVDPVAEENGINITVRNAEPVGRYIRPAGLDVTEGQIILRAGTQLSARAIGLASAAGLTEAVVSLRPRIGVLSTGDELVNPGTIPGQDKLSALTPAF